MTGIVLAAVQLLAIIQAGLTCYVHPIPPRIVFPAHKEIEVHPGSNFTLKCQNVFRLRWITPDNSSERVSVEEKNANEGELISVDWFESTFTRTDATPEDSGYYHCVQLGQSPNENITSDKIFVNVRGPPVDNIPSNNEEIPQQQVILSYEFKQNRLEITCQALLLDDDSYHMYWQVPNRHLRKSGQMHTRTLPMKYENGKAFAVRKLTIYNPTEKNDGLYTCTFTHGPDKNSAALILSREDIKFINLSTPEVASNDLQQ